MLSRSQTLPLRILSLSRRHYTAAHGDPAASSLADEFARRVSRGELQPDARQSAAVAALQVLQDALVTHVTQLLNHQPSSAAQRQADSQQHGGSQQHHHHHQPEQQAQQSAKQLGTWTSGSPQGGVGHQQLLAQQQQQHAGQNLGSPSRSQATPEAIENDEDQGQALRAAGGQTSTSSGPAAGVQGAYLYGHVGCGKTLLMDVLIDTTRQRLAQLSKAHSACSPTGQASASAAAAAAAASAAGRGVERHHFHTFMLHVHKRLHALQQARPRVVVPSRHGLPVYRYLDPEEDPLDVVAGEVAGRAVLLALDELHVTDVADAMILARLFDSILSRGTAVVFTSNRKPGDLYKGGLSYAYFRPFIDRIQRSLLVLKLGSGVDYRQATHTTSSHQPTQDPTFHRQQQQALAPADEAALEQAPLTHSNLGAAGPHQPSKRPAGSRSSASHLSHTTTETKHHQEYGIDEQVGLGVPAVGTGQDLLQSVPQDVLQNVPHSPSSTPAGTTAGTHSTTALKTALQFLRSGQGLFLSGPGAGTTLRQLWAVQQQYFGPQEGPLRVPTEYGRILLLPRVLSVQEQPAGGQQPQQHQHQQPQQELQEQEDHHVEQWHQHQLKNQQQHDQHQQQGGQQHNRSQHPHNLQPLSSSAGSSAHLHQQQLQQYLFRRQSNQQQQQQQQQEQDQRQQEQGQQQIQQKQDQHQLNQPHQHRLQLHQRQHLVDHQQQQPLPNTGCPSPARPAAALLSFQQLCGRSGLRAGVGQGGALSAPDFIALCSAVPRLYITDAPPLTPPLHDEARRFVTFLDVAYEHRTQLVIAASASSAAGVSSKPGTHREHHPAEDLLLPLLQEAARQGINPNLGRPTSTRLSLAGMSKGPAQPAAQALWAGRATHQSESPASLHGDTQPPAQVQQGGPQLLEPPASSTTGITQAAAALQGNTHAPGHTPSHHHHGPSLSLFPAERDDVSSSTSDAPPLTPEEVLMMSRAASRLAELTLPVTFEGVC